MPRFIIPLTIATILTLSACNTVKGIGNDMASAGNAISNSVDKVRR